MQARRHSRTGGTHCSVKGRVASTLFFRPFLSKAGHDPSLGHEEGTDMDVSLEQRLDALRSRWPVVGVL